jgi:hypothetical protein
MMAEEPTRSTRFLRPTDTCAHLAQRLKLLQTLFQHVTDPDRQAEIGDQIAEVEQQMRDNGCLVTKHPWAVLVLWVSDDPNDPAVVRVNDLPGIGNPDPNDPETALQLFNKFFTKDGADTYNAVRFFSDCSHGLIDISDSQVFVVRVPLTKDQVAETPQNVGELTVTQVAKAAALQQGVPLSNFYGIAITSHTLLAGAQGSPSFDGTPWAFMDYRWVRNNGTQSWGQEMGHGFGLDHSRRDGSDEDYLDPLDVMSTRRSFSGPDPDFGERGPGLNAWNMRCRNWLDESRVWHAPAGAFDQTLTLRPLHHRDLNGFLAAELPPLADTDGFPRYLVEYREKDGWDSGSPVSSIMVHRFEGPIGQALGTHSYVMPGTNGQFQLTAGDTFDIGEHGPDIPRVDVVSIDESMHTAVVRLRNDRFTTSVGLGSGSSADTTVVLARSAEGQILYNWWPLGGSGSWAELPGGGRTDAAPAAALVGPDHNYLFAVVKGLDGNVYLNQGTLGGAFVGWQQMGFQTTVAVGAGSSGDNTVLVATADDGRIFYNWWPLGGSGSWAELPGGGRTDAAPAAALVGPDHNYLFAVVKGLDGNVYLNQGTLGGAFVGWQRMNS